MAGERDPLLQSLLGYLNFSEGAPSPAFQRALNEWRTKHPAAPWHYRLATALRAELRTAGDDGPLGDLGQARTRLRQLFVEVLPAYWRWHRGLIGHKPRHDIFGPLLVARLAEAALAEAASGPPQDFVERVLERVSDYTGYRPLAVLENKRLADPYPHERLRPLPLWLKEVGAAAGPFAAFVEGALELLKLTKEDIRGDAFFDPAQLEELALDPRAYDFGHPANQRPGYQFAEWDPGRIGANGRYRRFVLRAPIVETLAEWVAGQKDAEAARFDASTVLAGAILLASGVCGGGPEDLGSEDSPGKIVQRVAQVRDRFYADVLERLAGPHQARLKAEAERDRQPFGGLRQTLNLTLGRKRAKQLQHDRLARMYARLGYPFAAEREAQVIATASTRYRCRFENALLAAARATAAGQPAAAFPRLVEARALAQDAIERGAFVDPWNLLGFGGQFPLFSHVGESVSDPRVDELLDGMDRLFGGHARALAAAAAAGDPVQKQIDVELDGLAEWWDQFASYEVSDLRRVCGRELAESARFVASALAEWRSGGAAAGDVKFWAQHAAGFAAPPTYTLVVGALLERGDLVAAQALLTHWLGQAETVPLEDPGHSFSTLCRRWLRLALAGPPAEAWPRVRRFFDFFEANADEYWRVPGLEILGGDEPPDRETAAAGMDESPTDDGDEDDEREKDLFGAAYEGVTFEDTADDGNDGATMDAGGTVNQDVEELIAASERLERRLSFLGLVARLWRHAAGLPWPEEARDTLAGWADQALANRRQLLRLLKDVQEQTFANPGDDPDALAEFGRQQSVREDMLHRIVAAAIDAGHAAMALRAAGGVAGEVEAAVGGLPWEGQVVRLRTALLRGDRGGADAGLATLLERIANLPVLYTPLQAGGDPMALFGARYLRDTLRLLALDLPALGMFRQTHGLLKAAQQMERRHVGDGRQITEFETLFAAGYKAVMARLAEFLKRWPETQADFPAAELAAKFVAKFSPLWTNHALGVRISEIERRSDRKLWAESLDFLRKYGTELFPPRFLQYANLRGVLHRGTAAWLEGVRRAGPDAEGAPRRLLADLDRGLPLHVAADHLEFILAALANHWDIFKDYNATTTQSDDGGNLHILFEQLKAMVGYEKNRWALRPAYLAHRIITAAGRPGAARLLQRAFEEETSGLASSHLERLKRVEKKYGVRLASVSDRLGERFVRPLGVDRAAALLGGAAAAKGDESAPVFQSFRHEIAELSATPFGNGMEIPPWLAQLETELEKTLTGGADDDDAPALRLPAVELSHAEVLRELARWEP